MNEFRNRGNAGGSVLCGINSKKVTFQGWRGGSEVLAQAALSEELGSSPSISMVAYNSI